MCDRVAAFLYPPMSDRSIGHQKQELARTRAAPCLQRDGLTSKGFVAVPNNVFQKHEKILVKRRSYHAINSMTPDKVMKSGAHSDIATALVGGVYKILEILGVERESGAQITGGRETNGAEFVAGPSSSEILLLARGEIASCTRQTERQKDSRGSGKWRRIGRWMDG